MPFTLVEIERAVRSAWSVETTFATEEYLARAPERPSRGQCGATALLVFDLLGGEMLVADLATNGVVNGVHYWNRLDGEYVDLTCDQFLDDESLFPPQIIERPMLPYPKPAREAYLLLRQRALTALGSPDLPHGTRATVG
jgi:hypothetical protein